METEASSVVAPGTEGYFGIQAGHVPLVAALKPGAVAKVSIQRKKAVLQLTLTPGVRPRPGKLPR